VASTLAARYPAVAMFRKRCCAGSHPSDSSLLRHVRKGRKGTVDTDRCRDNIITGNMTDFVAIQSPSPSPPLRNMKPML
jgi:hypothetical protein